MNITLKIGTTGQANIRIRSFRDVAGLESVEIIQDGQKIVIPNTQLSKFADAFRDLISDIDEDGMP